MQKAVWDWRSSQDEVVRKRYEEEFGILYHFFIINHHHLWVYFLARSAECYFIILILSFTRDIVNREGRNHIRCFQMAEKRLMKKHNMIKEMHRRWITMIRLLNCSGFNLASRISSYCEQH
jgi:hypothetical protein